MKRRHAIHNAAIATVTTATLTPCTRASTSGGLKTGLPNVR
ncbi:hypothetical protein [Fischerella sp.]|nr:hypothetical protein [Fischerella sp.]